MLKIKDNVNLKELEKYGFKFNQFPNKDVVQYKTNNNPLNICDITFFKKDRQLQFNLKSGYWCDDIDMLEMEYQNITNSYNCFKKLIDELIKDGLVEKVE